MGAYTGVGACLGHYANNNTYYNTLSDTISLMPVIGAPIHTVRLISLAKNWAKFTLFKYTHVHCNTCVTDIDECNIPMFCVESDNRICNNTIGSYKCNCKDGHKTLVNYRLLIYIVT